MRYGHKETAQKACAAMAEAGKTGLSEYRCSCCEGWHIGHKTNPSDWFALTQYNPKANYQPHTVRWARDEDGVVCGIEVNIPAPRVPKRISALKLKKCRLENLVDFAEYLMGREPHEIEPIAEVELYDRSDADVAGPAPAGQAEPGSAAPKA